MAEGNARGSRTHTTTEVIPVAKVPVVDQNECTGCESCVDIAPNTFKMNDDDVSEVMNPTGDPEDVIQQAIDDCPAECIAWSEG